jgi:hypothetical protein
MDDALLELLNQLEAIGGEHEEFFDDRAEEARSEALFNGFLKQEANYLLPATFALSTEAANERVRDALARFLPAARQAAQQDALDTFHKRFAALRKPHVRTEAWSDSADFFGWWWDPADFDEFGNRIGG